MVAEKTIAAEISDYVKEHGVKQNAIAEAIGIYPQSLSETLKGNRTLSAEEYMGICNFLEVPYDTFMRK